MSFIVIVFPSIYKISCFNEELNICEQFLFALLNCLLDGRIGAVVANVIFEMIMKTINIVYSNYLSLLVGC